MSQFLLRNSLLATSALVTLGWTQPAPEQEDAAAQRWHFSESNAQMKAGHKQIRQWAAARDSARQTSLAEISGPSAGPSNSPFAARSAAVATSPAPTPLGTEHSFADGRIKGRWALNQVTFTNAKGGYGSGVRLDRTVYDSAKNTVHALTEEGTLVKAPLVQLGAWSARNQIVQIDKPSFTGIRTPTGTFRLVGIVKGIFRWSDDEGLTWTESVGGASSSGGSKWTVTLQTGEILALVRRNVANVQTDVLIRSKDQAASFQDVKTWPATNGAVIVGTWLYNTADLCYLMRKSETGSALDVYRYKTGGLTLAGTIATGAIPTSMTGTVSGSLTRIFARVSAAGASGDGLGYMTDDGLAWKQVSTIVEDLETVVPDKPDVLFSNTATHQISSNAGATWGDYPSNNDNIGWDPKHVTFYKVAGKWTLLAANDMGLCFNADPLNTATWRFVNQNHTFAILHGGISVDNTTLTVTGNQDPGTFELTRSGRGTWNGSNKNGADGLRVASSNAGKAFWYRHYWATFMHNHAAFTADTRKASFDIPGNWYTPGFKGSTTPGEDAIYVAGGDSLVKLTYNTAGNSIAKTGFAKNFKTDAGDVTFGVGVSKTDPKRLYVATKNGHFFWSTDAGQSWTETSYNGTKPSAQWATWSQSAGIYIEVADNDPNLVFWGSGKGAAACLVSRDGGKTFVSAVTGLPTNQEVHNVSISPDGKLAFSSNFFVYIAADNKWYDLRAASMPSAALPTANAVYYLPLQRKVRYFTWGAGVLDLDITYLNTVDNPAVALNETSCYQILSGKSSKSASSVASGAVVQAAYKASPAQKWRFSAQDGGFYRIENTGNNQVLQVTGESYKEDIPVQTAAWSGTDNQMWSVVRNGTAFVLAARHSVKALKVASASVADSAALQQGTYLESADQKWNLVEATDCGTSRIGAPVPAAGRLQLLPRGGNRYGLSDGDQDRFSVLVYDQTGRVVLHEASTSVLDLTGQATGVYRVRVWGGHLDATRTVTVVP